MKIGLASDHAGFLYKERVALELEKMGYEVMDFGCSSDESCDYPDYAHSLAQAWKDGKIVFGFTFCGSGNGISMVMNRYEGLRSAVCWTEELARLARSHNDAQICAIPSRFIPFEEVKRIIQIFLKTPFDGGRHERRVTKIDHPE